jgi:hypothetical protein
MPGAYSVDFPPNVAKCLNLAQFLPSFSESRNHSLDQMLQLWRFHGEGVARLKQLSKMKKAAYRDGAKSCGVWGFWPKTDFRPRGEAWRFVFQIDQ